MPAVAIQEMVGMKFIAVYQTKDGDDDVLMFIADNGDQYRFYHYRDCCETVYIESIVGELSDLTGMPLLIAEESTNRTDPPSEKGSDDSYTWTFYKFATIKGYVDVRWYGTSNGYYSEGVSLEKIPTTEPPKRTLEDIRNEL